MVMTLLTRPKKTVATVVVATDGSGDTTDIQTGINMLPATGGVVYIKEGTYIITATITIPNSGIELIGAGSSTRIETTANIPIIYARNVDRISLHLLYIYGSSAGLGQHGIQWYTVRYSIISDCWIENCGGRGVFWREVEQSITMNSRISTNDGYGMMMMDSHDNHVYSNYMSDQTTYNGMYITSCDRNVFMENHVDNNNQAGINFSTNCSKNILMGNHCVGNGQNGISLSSVSEDNSIVGNRLDDNTAYGISITANCDRNIITGNHCRGNGSGSINEQGADDNLISNNLIDAEITYNVGVQNFQSFNNIVA